jgi:uncharacterized caspase-like protein
MRRCALIVGCKSYDDELISDLKYADSDAAQFANILLERFGLEKDEIYLVADNTAAKRMPTRGNILRSLSELSSSGRAPETVFFFFSGHGFQSAKGRQYFLCADSVARKLQTNALAFDDILEGLQETRAKHILLFLDACRSTVSDSKSGTLDGSLVDVNRLCPPGIVSFCSSAPGEASFESDKF